MIPDANTHPAEQDTGAPVAVEHGSGEAAEHGSGERGAEGAVERGSVEHGAGGYGVVARAGQKPDRGPSGRFLPGHRIQPPVPYQQRNAEAYLEALEESFPPARKVAMLEKAYQLAAAQKSSRGIIAVLDHIHDRMYGKPQTFVNVRRTNFEVLLATLQQPVTVDATVADDADGLTKDSFS